MIRIAADRSRQGPLEQQKEDDARPSVKCEVALFSGWLIIPTTQCATHFPRSATHNCVETNCDESRSHAARDWRSPAAAPWPVCGARTWRLPRAALR